MFLLGVAVAALASCTNEEVVSVPENAAINFTGAFVDKATKADVTTDNIEKFWVFGYYGTTPTEVFNNVGVNKPTSGGNWQSEETEYWTTGNAYEFGAYANGTSSLTTTTQVSFSATEKKLTFTNYEAGANDLIASTASVSALSDLTSVQAVPFTFKHMLAKVKFTFKTTATDYTMKVEDLQINNAIKTCTGSYTGGTPTITWETASATATPSAAYVYADIANYATTGSASTDACYVIPQSVPADEDYITVTFKVTASGDAISGGSKSATFTANLKTSGSKWTENYSYNYIFTINPDDVDGTLKPIEFTVTEVDGFEDDTDIITDVVPSVQP